jgi:hypothetical protein
MYEYECRPVSVEDADPQQDEGFFFQVLEAERLERDNLETQVAPQMSDVDLEVLHAMLAME